MSLDSPFWMEYIPVSLKNLWREFLNLDPTYPSELLGSENCATSVDSGV